jgi:hypothetical protein
MSKGKKKKHSQRKSVPSRPAPEQDAQDTAPATRYVGMFRGSSVAGIFAGATICIIIFCQLRGLSLQDSLIGGLVGGVCLTPAVIGVDLAYGNLKKRYQR